MNTHTVDSNTRVAAPPLNLVAEVCNVLTRLGHERPNDWMKYLHSDAMVEGQDNSIQRFLINRAMRLVLSEITNENTMDVRYCLVDQGEIHDWLRLFETGVAPWLIKHNLPHVKI